MKKALKFLLKLVLGIVVLVVVAVLALPLWFGPVGKSAANSFVPGVVGTDFHLGVLALNPYTGYFETGDMQLSNPSGYSEKYAVTLGSLVVDVEPLSVATDVIHIEEVTVRDVFVSYVKGGVNNVNNFQQIQYNVAGGKDKYEKAEAEKKAEAERQKASAPDVKVPEQKASDAKAEAEKPAKKVIIDRLLISGVTIKLGPVPIKIPVDIKLTDIGRKSGGATLEEAWDQIYAAVCNAAGALGDQLRAIGDFAGDAAKQAAAAAEKATKAAGEMAGQATKAAGEMAGQATKAIGNATEGTTKALGNATDATKKAAEGATKAVGDAAKKATEGATKALDSLKSLW